MNQPPTHDVMYWTNLVQASGSAVIVVATVALVWVTGLLVKATNRLAKVGEDTWKSNIKPVVWLLVEDGELTTSESASLNLMNACAVDVQGVRIHIYLSTYTVQDGKTLLHTRKAVTNNRHDFGDLEANQKTENYNFWGDARSALEYAVDQVTEILPQTLIGGLAVRVVYTHSITGQTYSYASEYLVEDLHRGALKITLLKDGDASLVA